MSTSLDVRLDLPCQVPWDQMHGDDRVRFCTQCNLNVHNLSAMTEAEAAAFLAMRDGRVCVAYEQRVDGTAVFAAPAGGTANRRSLPVVPYATPTGRRKRWLVPAAIAGAVATAGAAAALKPAAKPVIAAAAAGGGNTPMVAGGIGAPPPVAFDPRNPTVACRSRTADISYVLTHDPLAKALVAALPAGLDLIDVRYSVFPVGGTSGPGAAYVVGTAGDDAEQDGPTTRAVLWLMSTGSTFPNGPGSESVTAHRSSWHGGRQMFIDCDDAELARYLAHVMSDPS